MHDTTFAIDSRGLRDLRDHIYKYHPDELEQMVAVDPSPLKGEPFFGVENGEELSALSHACRDPSLFPVHMLADDKVVELIKRVEFEERLTAWMTVARTVYRWLRLFRRLSR